MRLGDRRRSQADVVVCLRAAAPQLNDILSRLPGSSMYGVVPARFISERSADACLEVGVGYVDLAGNCLINFDHVFLEAQSTKVPPGRKPPSVAQASQRIRAKPWSRMLADPLHSA